MFVNSQCSLFMYIFQYKQFKKVLLSAELFRSV